jgi:hypothetical protein
MIDANYNTIALLIFLIILVVFWVLPNITKRDNNNNEPFNGKQLNLQSEATVIEEPIRPTYYDPTTGSMMTGQDFIPQIIEEPWGKSYNDDVFGQSLFGQVDGLDNDDVLGDNKLSNSLCSKSCCSDQYPTPFKLKRDEMVCDNKKDFVPSNLFCNNAWQDSGCLCLTKKQSNFLVNRGNNIQ